VQDFGKVRDLDEIARREALWESTIDSVELRTGRQVAQIEPDEFRRLMGQEIDLKTFKKRAG
jgi:hypothetical protein